MFKLIVLLATLFVVSPLSYTGVLKAGQSGQGKNPMFFSISGSCVVNSGSATVSFKVISGWAKINGHKYTSGQSSNMSVTPGFTVSGEVSGGCEGWGQNNGPDDLNVTCTGSLGEALFLMEQGIDLTEKISETLTIPVGQNATYRNPMFFSVTASCIATATQTDTFIAHGVSGDMRVNNQDLQAGQSVTVQVSNGESVSLYCSGHAEAQLENMGPVPLTLVCNVNLAEEYIKYMLK